MICLTRSCSTPRQIAGPRGVSTSSWLSASASTRKITKKRKTGLLRRDKKWRIRSRGRERNAKQVNRMQRQQYRENSRWHIFNLTCNDIQALATAEEPLSRLQARYCNTVVPRLFRQYLSLLDQLGSAFELVGVQAEFEGYEPRAPRGVIEDR